MKTLESTRPGCPEPGGIVWLARAWVRFWFTPADPAGLRALRILAGLLFLYSLLPFAAHVEEMFGPRGWFDQQAYAEAARLPGGPPRPFGWSLLYVCGNNGAALQTVYWASLAVLVLFTLGVAPRLTSVLTWVMVASFTANPVLASEGDAYLALLAFYLMIGHVLTGQRQRHRSLFFRLFGPRWGGPSETVPSLGANLAMRLLQVHFALAILANGLHKLQFGDWWAGVAFWYELYSPLATTRADVILPGLAPRLVLGVLSIAAYATLGWELAFPLFAWRRACRPVLLGGAGIGALGVAFLYGIPLAGPALVVCCLAYLSADEWHALRRGLGRVLRWRPAVRVPATAAAGADGRRAAAANKKSALVTTEQ